MVSLQQFKTNVLRSCYGTEELQEREDTVRDEGFSSLGTVNTAEKVSVTRGNLEDVVT